MLLHKIYVMEILKILGIVYLIGYVYIVYSRISVIENIIAEKVKDSPNVETSEIILTKIVVHFSNLLLSLLYPFR